jgi:hypothetical protein
MKVTIDRFEGDYAVCEKPDRTMINIKKDKLPSEPKEGDMLVIEKVASKMMPAVPLKGKNVLKT